ncbi:MAG: hypothetical protein R3C26_13515 [Calditrichia bacterium]
MRSSPGKINTPNDVFEFTAPAVVKSEDLAKEDVDNINVFRTRIMLKILQKPAALTVL